MVSCPLEPAPVVETGYPLELRKIWRFLTSLPLEPRVRERVKVEVVVVTGVEVSVIPRDVAVTSSNIPWEEPEQRLITVHWYFLRAFCVA